MGSDASRKKKQRSKRLLRGWALCGGAFLVLLMFGVGVRWLLWPGRDASASGAPGNAPPGPGHVLGGRRLSDIDIEVCPSGDHRPENCKIVLLRQSHGLALLKRKAGIAYGVAPPDVRLFDTYGFEFEKDTHLNTLVNHSRLYIVKGDNHFFWPTVTIGHRFFPRHIESPDPTRPISMETLSESPRVFLIENFLSDAEVDYLVKHAEGRLQRSHVGIGKETFHNQRTSKTAWDTNSEMSLKIQRRAFDLVRIPYMRNQADAIQVIRYEEGQMYLLHTDYFAVGYDTLDSSKPDGTNRIVTIFMYLSDVEAGGATVFPHSKVHENLDPGIKTASEFVAKEHQVNERMHACDSATALKVKPKRRRAILFYNQLPDGSLDHNSEHGGCPVASGRKWAANVWIWNRARPKFDSAGRQVKKKKTGAGSSWFFGGDTKSDGDQHGEVKIEFSNERQMPIEVFWQAPTSELKSFGTLLPNQRLPINTFTGHKWVIKDKGSGEVIREVTASAKQVAISII